MSFRSIFLLTGFCFITACSPNGTHHEQAEPADLLFWGGEVHTMDPKQSIKQAIAVKQDKIVWVGNDSNSEVWTGPETKKINLRGRMVIPGIQDAHIHPIMSGLQALNCPLDELTTLEQYLKAIRICSEHNKDRPWILGGGWSMSVFGPGAMPDKTLLDAIIPDKPVFLVSSDGHTGWANSVALERAGITGETPDPVDGRIDRNETSGEPVGSLQEGAMALIEKVLPAVSPSRRQQALLNSIRMLNRYGITSIQDAMVSESDLISYQTAQLAGQLSLRVRASLWWDRTQGIEQLQNMIRLRETYSEGLLNAGTIKIMQDGVMENYTAVLLEPYRVNGSPLGIPMIEPELLKEIVSLLDANDFQVHFHAIGDGAIRQSLNAVQAAGERNGNRDSRHHISHLQIINKADIPRFAELAVVANFQPLWAFQDDYIVDLTLPFISEEQANQLYPIASVVNSGGKIAFGSDWSVSTANPFPQIEVAVTRLNPETSAGPALLEGEKISVNQALAAFTINAAFTNHLDHTTGSLETGKLADFIVLDQNLFTVPASEISETKVLLTLFNGRTVHGSFNDLQQQIIPTKVR